MYWTVYEEQDAAPAQDLPIEGRFVLHRHRDAEGPHLDLRLEQDGYLLGWRIGAVTLAGEPWATEKAPHPARWLEQDADAVREDEGIYLWLERSESSRRVLLKGRNGDRVLKLERAPGLPAHAARELCRALAEAGMPADEAARLVKDGLVARRRAVERLCGLGRELDGDAFDERLWRKAIESLSLDEIHAQLRSFEVRFDHKYPPQPVSKPEPLPEGPQETRQDAVLTILREGSN